ncbi:bifunctional 4-hydroxy-2-oxoglutarate aldolase/2-dehydro-3-deoxy-phosphogluconate aldolase [Niveispirillum irakense]|uniref:bifunctional 4-hydroxy-2-oxoglutarate aldolase/2-dehydro-3-deoxy-phosphogluconate aldolase n=1 Tax=Niveispirillum irakense TaxID=34011 RepID=UPI0003F7DA40|nr:bifunctional 4-hydroxy-2-oxoglutarate aldolase/2-dehydro-3-deoxy-phosphogluconate aldolase [Niveispirillum irakense]
MTTEIERICSLAPVIPVIVIDRLEDAVPLATALVAGGLPVLEVTLRSPVAVEALAAMAKVPGAVVGAGTILEPGQIDQVAKAGAKFIVSPGCYPELADAAIAQNMPYLPGVATPSEMMMLLARGIRHQKLFPATVVGGMDMLKAVASPLRQIRFCPTGGVNAANAEEFLALPNVMCVGGSWVTPNKLVAAKDWAGIEALAREAAALKRPA